MFTGLIYFLVEKFCETDFQPLTARRSEPNQKFDAPKLCIPPCIFRKINNRVHFAKLDKKIKRLAIARQPFLRCVKCQILCHGCESNWLTFPQAHGVMKVQQRRGNVSAQFNPRFSTRIKLLRKKVVSCMRCTFLTGEHIR